MLCRQPEGCDEHTQLLLLESKLRPLSAQKASKWLFVFQCPIRVRLQMVACPAEQPLFPVIPAGRLRGAASMSFSSAAAAWPCAALGMLQLCDVCHLVLFGGVLWVTVQLEKTHRQ